MKMAPSVLSRITTAEAIWNKSSICQLNALLKGWEIQGDVMTTLQAICLGAMLSWTPSLVVLAALLLREAPLEELERDPS